MKFVDYLASFISGPSGDLIDKFHWIILPLMFYALSGTFYFGQSLTCAVPAQFPYSWQTFIETMCFTEGAFYAVTIRDSYHIHENPANQLIHYYPWISWIFLFQGFFFYITSTPWAVFGASDLVWSTSRSFGITNPDKRKASIQKAVTTFVDGAQLSTCFGLIRRANCFPYFVAKSLQLLNVVAQIWFMKWFVRAHVFYWPIDVVLKMSKSSTNINHVIDSLFPRRTYCEIELRGLGNVHNYSIDCAMPMNLYHRSRRRRLL